MMSQELTQMQLNLSDTDLLYNNILTLFQGGVFWQHFFTKGYPSMYVRYILYNSKYLEDCKLLNQSLLKCDAMKLNLPSYGLLLVG